MVKNAPAPARPAAKPFGRKASDAPVSKVSRSAKAPAPKGPRSKCPINLLLEVVGDAWSLLIIRDLMFKGRSTYKAFLNAEEKIATNILADRLSKLETAGLISKATDPDDARKYIYRLTEKGADLAPVLVEMMLWSNKYHITDTPKDFLASLQKNKATFTNRIVRDIAAPSTAPVPAVRPVTPRSDARDETLNLFDGF